LSLPIWNHPIGLVHSDDPSSKIIFLAAEALKGVGGILLDANGKRFCCGLGRNDDVTGEMNKKASIQTCPFQELCN
jgi:aspartate oxidase